MAMIRETTQTHQRWLIAGGRALLVLILLVTMIAQRAKRRRQANVPAVKKPDPQATEHSKQPDRKAALRALEKACAANDRHGAALWDEFRHGLQEKKTTEHHHDDGLRPLYPQHL